MIDDLEDISELKEIDLSEFFEIKKREDNEKTPKRYVQHKNPYEIPSPDYLFLLGKIKEISNKRA